VKAGFVQTIQVLLEHAASREALDNRGRTRFDWLGQAAKSVDRAVVRDALRTTLALAEPGRDRHTIRVDTLAV